MRKFFILAFLAVTITSILTSCGTSKKTGCPGTEGIIH